MTIKGVMARFKERSIQAKQAKKIFSNFIEYSICLEEKENKRKD